MGFYHSRFYSQLIQFSDYILLSILWGICLLPIITIVPATISLFTVIRAWKKGTSQGLLVLFFGEFKQHFLQKSLLSLFLVSFIFVLYQNVQLITPIENPSNFILFLLLGLSFLLLMSFSVHFFNIYVRSEEKKIRIIFKNTIILTISRFHWTILGLGIVFLDILFVLFLPFMIFVVASFTGYLLVRISDKAVKSIKVEQLVI
ncbi:DUF624 domain-containing protein [Bacillus sp. SD088]|uniref:DUF624 domain-containing protein n=1 Tax=Bacillus sp. SD088 TaxID=2782012 RepID=UPI001A95C8B8|nr:DUF624 domain-containing protein [Bacillus sp. SD088]MBO0995661.1 DUF624 domain-containing protein [Bacillus sp. SD088]